MKCFQSIVLLLCYLQCMSANNDLNQRDYTFDTNVTVSNNASSDISQWSLSGRLKIQLFNTFKLMQFEDLRTTAFNGPFHKLKESKNGIVIEDSNVLYEPFIVHLEDDDRALNSVSFLPTDLVWSMNLKKAFAHFYHLDSIVKSQTGEKSMKHVEHTIFGKCKVYYEVPSSENDFMLSKEIDYNNCELENISKHWWKKESFGYLTGTSARFYTFEENVTDANKIKAIASDTILKYRVLQADRIIHEIRQKQFFNLLLSTATEEIIDVSKFTIKKNLEYEFYNFDIYSNIKSQEILKNTWQLHFEDFRKMLNQNSLDFINDNTFNVIDKLFSASSYLDFEKLHFFEDENMKDLLLSLLPHIGSQSSVQFLSKLIFKESLDEMSQLKLLATFPFFIETLDETTIQNLEALLEVKSNITKSVTQTYILSFSNIISKLNNDNNPKHTNTLKKYVNKYYKLFTESNSYDTRMNYLLGLMNMGDLAKKSLMTVVLNTTESHHIRSIATYAIKPLIRKTTIEGFKIFWPIVKNNTEVYDLRVAVLHLLLESDIGSRELYEMLNYMNQIPDDPKHQHLHNYFYTSMQSGKSDCDNCTMKMYSEKILAELNPPVSFKGLMTGNYHISYSDSEKNFECAIDTHLVANPITNFVNVYQISFKKYISSQITDSFSVFIRAEGVSSRLFEEIPANQHPIEELYKILINNKFTLQKEEDLHIELIFYHRERAIYGFFINEDNFDDIEYFINELIQYLRKNNILFMKETGRLEFVSDIGTPIRAIIKQEYTLSTKIQNANLIFFYTDEDDDHWVSAKVKSIWNLKANLITYNPITDISHGVSKIHSTQMFLNLKIFYNINEFYIKWKDDESYFDFLVDYKHAVFVDKPNELKKYCSECSSITFYTVAEKAKMDIDLWLWVKQVSIKDVNCKNIEFLKKSLPEIMNKSHMTYVGYPLAQPLILIMYIIDYLYNLPPSDTCSISIKTNPILKEPNMSILQLTFNTDPVDENRNINVNFNITLALTQSRLSDSKTMNQWRVNIQRQEFPKGDMYDILYDNIVKSVKLVLHSKINVNPAIPNVDMFSLQAAEPIISKTIIHYDEEQTISTNIEINTIFSITDENKNKIYGSKNWKQCYEASINASELRKHTPPTKPCFATSLAISTYDKYEFDFKFENISGKLKQFLDFHVIKPWINELREIDEDIFHISFAYSALPANVNLEINGQMWSNYTVPNMFRPRALLKSKTKLIEDITFATYGFESICIITPNYIKTFTEETITYDLSIRNMNLIECSNKTRLGIVTKIDYKKLSVKLWSDVNIFTLNTKNNGCNIRLNNNLLKKNMQDDDVSAEYFKDNMCRLTTGKFEVIYNEEYVMIKMKSALLNQFCGICTGESFDASYI